MGTLQVLAILMQEPWELDKERCTCRISNSIYVVIIRLGKSNLPMAISNIAFIKVTSKRQVMFDDGAVTHMNMTLNVSLV